MTEQESTPILPASAGTRIEDLLREFVSRADELLLTQERMNGLLAAVVSLTEDLSLEGVLERVVHSACTLLHAQYGALGVLGGDGGLSHFVTVGMDEDVIRRIGHPPRGHGVLGLLIKEPRPLRLTDLREHPESYGFPPNHPAMLSFLGVPIRVRDEVFGNLYLTEKTDGGDFTSEDEDLAVALAAAAGTAIENARLFDDARHREQWLQACMDVSGELMGSQDTADDEWLDCIAARACRESGTALALIALPGEGAALHCAAAAGESAETHRGAGVSRSADVAAVLESGEAYVGNDSARILGGKTSARLGPVLIAPFGQSADGRGILVLARPLGSAVFSPTEAEMSTVYCSYASLALELARTSRLREQLVIFTDRERIARDLHDVVIQRLFAAGLSMQSLRRFTTDAVALDRITAVTDELDETIRELRDTIYSLRSVPQSTGKLSSRILRIVQEAARPLSFAPRLRFDGQVDGAVPEEVGQHLLAVVSEGLSNAVRHARASDIDISVSVADGRVTLLISDDGVGFTEPGRRSGLANMQRRAALAGGNFDVQSSAGKGTRLNWSAPVGA